MSLFGSVKKIFRIPETNYTSLIDIGKFEMIWRVNVALFFIFIFLFFIRLFLGESNLLTSTLAFAVSVFNFIILYRTRQYKLVSVISVICGIAICQILFFVMHDDRLLSDALWVVLVSYFAFFMLGIFAGYLTLFLNVTGLLLYLIMLKNGTSELQSMHVGDFDIPTIINVYYVAFAVGYLSHKMIQTNHEINQKLEKENKKNELLMKEIHHRVKNNLQIMSSLLNLQANESNNPTVQKHFNEAIGRIRSMALIHEQMYQSDNLAATDIRDFLLSLADHISSSVGIKGEVKLDFQSDLKELDIKVLVPLSLIFNELLTNSLKHGFDGKTGGSVQIHILIEGDRVVFNYRDDGEWKPKNDEQSSFGLNLIDTLTEQLDGTYLLRTEKGTEYKFSFDSKHFISI